MKITLLLLVILVIARTHAQSYQISFAGKGASTVVDSVKVENLTQCKDTSLIGSNILHLSITGTVGVNETNKNAINALRIYPSPMTDNCVIEFEATASGNTTIELYDITGKRTIQEQAMLTKGIHTYQLSGINSGVYFLKITSDTYSYYDKIISSNTKAETAQISYKVTSTNNGNQSYASNTAITNKTRSRSERTTIEMQYTTTSLLTDLVGWWKFDEASGTTAIDASGNGHNGTLVNSPARITGKVGTGALSFDGVSTFVDIPSSPDFDFPGDFSVSAWVYSKITDRVTAIGRSNLNLWNLWVMEQVNNTRFDMEYQDRTVYGQQAHRSLGSGLGYTINAWHHVCGVKSGNTFTIYVDKSPGTLSAPIGTGDTIALAGMNITIGSRRTIPDSPWNGYIDDVRIYNRALSTIE